ncbi:MAG: hypothetical protein IJ911_13350 [Salinivirgaceae bacterium]|nr:hypothetical protein [Salinivirgaceae bacterium]
MFVLAGANDYSISTMLVKNDVDKGKIPEIVWNIDGTKEKKVTFTNYQKKQRVHLYYNDNTGCFPSYVIELVRVEPNIAYKQKGDANCIIKEDKRGDNINRIELSGNTVSLRPIFLTLDEKQNGYDDINKLFNRNEQCSYMISSIKIDNQEDTELTLEWKEYSLRNKGESLIYEIAFDNSPIITKGVISTANISPFVTIVRSSSNTETGYFIEDYYSTSFGNESIYPSLRAQNNTMKMGDFDVLGDSYKIPIVHYKKPCKVRLLLDAIPKVMNPSPLCYVIEDNNVVLGSEFLIQTPPSGTILDIKDVDGNIKGQIEFRQINEPLLKPTLNLVTINDDENNVDFSVLLNDINAVYNTINVSWQRGREIKLSIDVDYSLKINSKDKSVVNTLRSNPGYKEDEYYFIITTQDIGASGYAVEPLLNGNMVVMKAEYDKRVPPHELGHCSGLDEYVVNIGLIPSNLRNEAKNKRMQYSNTNIMSYSDEAIKNSNPLLDFYSWQINIIREHIIKRINTKK